MAAFFIGVWIFHFFFACVISKGFAWEMNRDHSVSIEIAFKEMVKLLLATQETRV